MNRSLGAAVVVAAGIISGPVLVAPVRAQTKQTCQGTTITPGSPTRVICSKSFGIKGQCGVAQPQFPWNGWQDVAIAVQPWEPSSITIVNVSLDLRLTGPGPLSLGAFSGDGYDPDEITPYRYFDTTGNVLDAHIESPPWPAGSGMQFPAKTPRDALPDGPHIDAHIDCTAGANYDGYEFIWYTVP